MNGNLNDSTSIYLQIAAMLEDNIVRDLLLEEEQAPSTNELAKALSINPAIRHGGQRAEPVGRRGHFVQETGDRHVRCGGQQTENHPKAQRQFF